MKKRSIDFLLIGAQKCATSWLYYCLKEHPQISVPTSKMEIGFIGGDLFKQKGEDWFFNRFPVNQENKVVGDISVDYLYHYQSAIALKPYTHRGTKFLISMREPVDRLISGYYWMLRTGQIPNLPIEKGLEEILDQPQGFDGKVTHSGYSELIYRAFYGKQLSFFLEHYDRGNFLIYDYENIKRDPLNVLQGYYKMLNVEIEFKPPSFNSRPKQNSFNNLLFQIENRTSKAPYIIRYTTSKIANMLHQLAHKNTKDHVPGSLKDKLKFLYKPVNEQLVSVLIDNEMDDKLIANVKKWNS